LITIIGSKIYFQQNTSIAFVFLLRTKKLVFSKKHVVSEAETDSSIMCIQKRFLSVSFYFSKQRKLFPRLHYTRSMSSEKSEYLDA